MDRTAHFGEGAIATGPVRMRAVSCDAHEPEAFEDPTASADYGSLIGRGPRKFKKKPVIVLDPAEAETGARLIQHLATKQWTDNGKCGEPASRVMLHPAELEASIADFVAGVELDLDEGGVTPADKAPSQDFAAVAETFDDIAPPEPTADALEEPAGQLDEEGPAPIEEATTPEPDWETAALAEPIGLPAPEDELPSPEPDSGVHGHNLRARVVQTPPQETLRERIATLLRAIWNWMKRNWL